MQTNRNSVVAVLCTASLLCAATAFAAQTTELTITGTVVSECRFTSGPYSMPFGTLSATATADAVASTTITYQCTNGTAAASIKINSAASPTTVNIANLGNSANTLPVRLAWVTPTTQGVGIGSALPLISVTVAGTITKADINAAVAGSYASTYNVDLSP